MIGGKKVLDDGEIRVLDEEKLFRKAQAITERVQQKLK